MAVLISMVVSLTTTPMMCALILPRQAKTTHGRLYNLTEAVFDGHAGVLSHDARGRAAPSLHHVLRVLRDRLAQRPSVPRGALQPVSGAGHGPDDRLDPGRSEHLVPGDEARSSRSCRTIVQEDPAVATVVGVTGGRQVNSGFVYISLKPYAQRKITADGVVNRLRGKLAQRRRARGCSWSRSRICAPAAGRPTRPINIRCSPTTRRSSTNGRRG